eukprot:1158979-Pelagomonas_calceolata.AAC.2
MAGLTCSILAAQRQSVHAVSITWSCCARPDTSCADIDNPCSIENKPAGRGGWGRRVVERGTMCACASPTFALAACCWP